MRTVVEYDAVRMGYKIYMLQEPNHILHFDTVSVNNTVWDEYEPNEDVEPTMLLDTQAFHSLFDAMSEFVHDYGTPDAIILMAFNKEQQRVDKMLDKLLED